MNHQLYSLIKTTIQRQPKKPVFIFDLDGTLACGKHRLHALPVNDLHLTESWLEFNRLSELDSPIDETISVMNMLHDAGGIVIILTGRSDDVIESTTEWLASAGARYNVMVMRGRDDNRKDTIIKEEFLRYIGLERITAAWDDSPKVIEHFRGLGITTYQVCDYGDKLHSGLESHGVDQRHEAEAACTHDWIYSDGPERSFRFCASCGSEEDKPVDHGF